MNYEDLENGYIKFCWNSWVFGKIHYDDLARDFTTFPLEKRKQK